jgi:hypothetical protein
MFQWQKRGLAGWCLSRDREARFDCGAQPDRGQWRSPGPGLWHAQPPRCSSSSGADLWEGTGLKLNLAGLPPESWRARRISNRLSVSDAARQISAYRLPAFRFRYRRTPGFDADAGVSQSRGEDNTGHQPWQQDACVFTARIFIKSLTMSRRKQDRSHRTLEANDPAAHKKHEKLRFRAITSEVFPLRPVLW